MAIFTKEFKAKLTKALRYPSVATRWFSGRKYGLLSYHQFKSRDKAYARAAALRRDGFSARVQVTRAPRFLLGSSGVTVYLVWVRVP